MAPLRLGGFELAHLLGRGGMAEVYDAVHVATSQRVAVKVITAVHAQRPAYLEAFRREVQAMAALRHRNIALVLDCGEIDEATAAVSEGGLSPGSPFLVMERAAGALPAVAADAPLRWSDVKHVLVSLLDALAYAHARGLIHRDIKPDNLLAFAGGAQPVWKLSDFGIAHDRDTSRPGDVDQVVGTVGYMAPEQLVGTWRDFVPATDLYAVGCLTYELVTGRPPYHGRTAREIASKHIHQPPPAIAPAMATPLGLQSWVERLIAKSPLDRFRRAADARAELLALPEPAEASAAAPAVAGHAATAPLLTSDLRSLTEELARAAPAAQDPPRERLSGYRLPPVPDDWRDAHPPPAPTPLVQLSTRLYPLRAVPIVGRGSERDWLWRAMLDVVSSRRARCLIIEGPSGSGKSCLAEWLSQRADELGVATRMWATHSAMGSRADGLAMMLARATRSDGLDAAAMQRRLDKLISSHGVAESWASILLRRIIAEAAEDAPSATGQRPEVRAAVICEFVAKIASWRPAIVWLDDVHWGNDALTLLQTVAAHGVEAPVLFVATAQSEALREQPEAAAILDDLSGKDRFERRRLDKLSVADTALLLRGMLQLDDATQRRVVAKVDGNPLFALQLVGDWVARGVLTLNEAGYRLVDGHEPIIPDDLHAIWRERIQRLLEERPSDDRRALGLAAVLGLEVSDPEWRGLCARAGIAVAADLVATLVEHGLAQYRESGWAFIHAMLQDSLLRMMREAGELRSAHRLAAQHLDELGRAHIVPGLSGRVGRHLVACEDRQAALAPLLAGSLEREGRGDYRQALELLDLRDRVIRELGPGHERSGLEGVLARARVDGRQGLFDRAAQHADRVRQLAETLGWDDLVAHALAERCDIEHLRGRLGRAIDMGRAALDIFERLGAPEGIALAQQRIADCSSYTGDIDDAQRRYALALEIHRATRDDFGAASCAYGLGFCHQQRGDHSAARVLFQQAERSFLHLGADSYALRARTSLADIDREEGRLEEARRTYLAAAAYYETVSHGRLVVAQTNLCLTAMAAGDLAEAKRWLARIRSSTLPHEFLEATMLALELAMAAGDHDWNEWDRCMDLLMPALESTGVLERDDVVLLEQAAALTRAGGEAERAARILALAARLWTRLGCFSP